MRLKIELGGLVLVCGSVIGCGARSLDGVDTQTGAITPDAGPSATTDGHTETHTGTGGTTWTDGHTGPGTGTDGHTGAGTYTGTTTTTVGTAPSTTGSTIAPEIGPTWVLVRSEVSGHPHEAWKYDEQGRIAFKRRLMLSREYSWYATNHTYTYEADRIVEVVEPDPVDLPFYYVKTYNFETGLLREIVYTSDPFDGLTTLDYDANQRLVRIREELGDVTETRLLERRETGEPFQFFINDVLTCTYHWRVNWLNTECYDENGEVRERYEGLNGRLVRYNSSLDATVFDYDEAGRLIYARDRSYVYDAVGRLLSLESPTYSEYRTYDELGLLRKVETTDGNVTLYEYERLGPDEVKQRLVPADGENSNQPVVEKIYRLLPHAPQPEPGVPDFSEELRITLPEPYERPLDLSVVE